MDNAFAWINQIMVWVGRLIPRWEILEVTEGAVKFVGGKKAVFCGPGIHWWWPAVSTWNPYPTVRQADRLLTQTFVTTDDKVVAISGIIVYSVTDLLLLLTTTHNAAIAVKDLALTAIHDVCCQMSWEELKSEQRKGTLDTKLRNTTQKALNDFGVKVEKVMLVDLSPARVLKVLQSVSQEEN
jgi:regulator of protease activity HflC (stomatin/prohibitin superfamily)